MLLINLLAVGILTIPSAILTVLVAAFLFFTRSTTGAQSAAKASDEALTEQVACDLAPRSPQEELFSRITYQMDVEHLYLQPGLSIDDLAMALGTNRTYVSRSINDLSGSSFTEYLNGYRVRYAQSLIEMGGPGTSVAEVGEMSGYASDASFFRNFKKFSGCTPSEWANRTK